MLRISGRSLSRSMHPSLLRPAVTGRMPLNLQRRPFSERSMLSRPDSQSPKDKPGNTAWIILLSLLAVTGYKTYDAHVFKSQSMDLHRTQQRFIEILAIRYNVVYGLFRIQYIDRDLDAKAELGACSGALAYFQKLWPYSLLEMGSPMEEFYQTVFHVLAEFVAEEKGEEDHLRQELHTVLRKAADEIHEVLAEYKGEDPHSTALEVVSICGIGLIGAMKIWAQLEQARLGQVGTEISS
ncbi:hypothetical protein FB45DRAFT_457163 [Roridomyces roridus]|uniref:Uncharacterized protein n=1 Tax=Roridomyces roridus TaxID=1738132 RepID=A0AAD7FQK4_9AGAR|nr:hypothetical protein FB45DRAFT_457163 [Roridomyces roridus]